MLPTPPVPPTVELVPPEPEDPQATAIANGYIRTGPATNYPPMACPYGALARVIGKSEDSLWWVVRLIPRRLALAMAGSGSDTPRLMNVEDVQTIANSQAATHSSTPRRRRCAGGHCDRLCERTQRPRHQLPCVGCAPPGAPVK